MTNYFSIRELRTISKSDARRLIVEAFQTGEIDANAAFYFASECDIELGLA
jgi:hypothetical protein